MFPNKFKREITKITIEFKTYMAQDSHSLLIPSELIPLKIDYNLASV